MKQGFNGVLPDQRRSHLPPKLEIRILKGLIAVVKKEKKE